MVRETSSAKSKAAIVRAAPAQPAESSFAEVVLLIQQSRQRAYQVVNSEMIDLYWRVGEYISRRIESEGWGKSTIVALAAFIQRAQPGIRGFSPQNLWRMRQFYDTYCAEPKLSTLVRELPWSSNLHILNKAKLPEEREFYLRMSIRNRWPVREVARQINASLFERTVLHPIKLSTALREVHPQAAEFFKDNGFQSVVTLKGWCWAHDPEIRAPNKKLRELSPISNYWPNDLKKPLFSSSL